MTRIFINIVITTIGEGLKMGQGISHLTGERRPAVGRE
jgi:hypothetical protein